MSLIARLKHIRQRFAGVFRSTASERRPRITRSSSAGLQRPGVASSLRQIRNTVAAMSAKASRRKALGRCRRSRSRGRPLTVPLAASIPAPTFRTRNRNRHRQRLSPRAAGGRPASHAGSVAGWLAGCTAFRASSSSTSCLISSLCCPSRGAGPAGSGCVALQRLGIRIPRIRPSLG